MVDRSCDNCYYRAKRIQDVYVIGDAGIGIDICLNPESVCYQCKCEDVKICGKWKEKYNAE